MSKIEDQVIFSEEQAKVIMTQLLLTIDYFHQCQYVHRDIKLENILINRVDDNQYDVKLADLGLAAKLPRNGAKLEDKCGTPCYVAPEILRAQGYREKSDIFSLGSVFFNIVTRRYLFNGKDVQVLILKNKNCDLSQADRYLVNIP